MSTSPSYSLTTEDVVYGSPCNTIPTSLSFSPNNNLTLLFPDSLTGRRQLYSYDSLSDSFQLFVQVDSMLQQKELSYEEELRRERMRLFLVGITSYSWGKRKDEKSARLMIPMNGQILVCELNGMIYLIYDGEMGSAIDPVWSPDGTKIAFVLNRDLYYIDIPDEIPSDPLSPVRLTNAGAQNGVSCGLADFLAQEEMDRYRGYWWSPDSSKIVFEVLDETLVPEFSIQHLGDDNPYRTETHRYPFAGGVNPFTGLSIVEISSPLNSLSTHSPSGALLPPLLPLPYLTLTGDLTPPLSPEILTSKYHSSEDNYIARVDWVNNGEQESHLFIQIQNRLQSTLSLLHIDPLNPSDYHLVLSEYSEVWINLHDLLYFLPSHWSPRVESMREKRTRESEGEMSEDLPHIVYFLWGSERSGFMKLYLYKYDLSGKSPAALHHVIGIDEEESETDSKNDWVIDGIVGVDERQNLIYFTGSKHHVTQKHVYVSSLLSPSVSSFPSLSVRITPEEGTFSDVAINISQNILVAVHSSLYSPPSLFLMSLPSASYLSSNYSSEIEVNYTQRKLLYSNLSSALLASSLSSHSSTTSGLLPSSNIQRRNQNLLPVLRIPELHTMEYITTKQEKVFLECSILKPDSEHFGPGPYPCIVSVYGGPHVQRVTNNWTATADMRAQRLCQAGYLVLRCDNRGSSRRGLLFEGAIKHFLGGVEVEDQSAAVRYFGERNLIDLSRVGIYGWSYGGYMTAMCLCKAANIFSCGVSGAPVTSWDGYDTHYTERYMGRPIDNSLGYLLSDVKQCLSSLKGKLLLVHGGIDENVHFRHTSRLISAMVQERKKYDLMFFPSERHSPRHLEGLLCLEDSIMDYFLSNL